MAGMIESTAAGAVNLKRFLIDIGHSPKRRVLERPTFYPCQNTRPDRPLPVSSQYYLVFFCWQVFVNFLTETKYRLSTTIRRNVLGRLLKLV